MKGRMPTGPICSNCGSGWDREKVRGKLVCPRCDYPFREHRTPLHMGERHDETDYIDVEELVTDDE